MDKAMAYFAERLELISTMIEKMYLMEQDKKNTFAAIINGEDHTIGIPLVYEMQSHPDIIKASCIKPDSLIQQIVIEIVVDDPKQMQRIISESIGMLMTKIKHVQSSFADIRHKTYDSYFKNGKSIFYDYDYCREQDPTKSDKAGKTDKNMSRPTKSDKAGKTDKNMSRPTKSTKSVKSTKGKSSKRKSKSKSKSK
jgi:DNA-directed RNA polymerase subunit L